MVLERTQLRSSKLLVPSLRYINLTCCLPGKICEVLKKVGLPKGAEDFEGLTHIKGGQFLIASDHNGKGGKGSTIALITLH